MCYSVCVCVCQQKHCIQDTFPNCKCELAMPTDLFLDFFIALMWPQFLLLCCLFYCFHETPIT